MNKKMDIRIYQTVEENSDGYHKEQLVTLAPNEYKNIYINRKINQEELDMAIDTIATACMQKQIKSIYVDLDIKNSNQSVDDKVKEMTIEEIETELGYPFKIVKKENDYEFIY